MRKNEKEVVVVVEEGGLDFGWQWVLGSGNYVCVCINY